MVTAALPISVMPVKRGEALVMMTMKVVHGEVRVKIPSLQRAARSSSALEMQAGGWLRWCC